ncbi:MAG: hypothetical protein ACK4FF_11795 [Limnobacter sp.]|uniref:hypothetical protein n=1 Tax=Limnobacter sp. TaxID=2003368 RepID=UPI0039194159
MNLEKAREFYYFYTGKTSDVARQLSFAAIAIIWLFSKRDGVEFYIASDLLLSLKLVVLALVFDLLQYIIGSFLWGLCQRSYEKQGVGEEINFEVFKYINWPTICCFWLKVILLALSYVSLFIFLQGVVKGVL